MMPDEIDQQIDELRVLFLTDQKAQAIEFAEAAKKRRMAHLEKCRDNLIARKWQPHACRACWRAVLLMNPDLCCKEGRGEGELPFDRWWIV
jgi:hypothetical protein